MSKQPRYQLSAGHGLNLERAEAFVESLGRDSELAGQIQIDLGACRHVDIGAGWRLGNALRRTKNNCHLTFLVPPIKDFSGLWFQNFTRSGLGLAIATYADSVFSGAQNITSDLRKYYSSPKVIDEPVAGLQEFLWAAPNFCMVTSLHEGVLDPNESGEFYLLLHKLLRYVSFDVDVYPEDDLKCLIDMLFQSVQNVYDHAARRPLTSEINVTS